MKMKPSEFWNMCHREMMNAKTEQQASQYHCESCSGVIFETTDEQFVVCVSCGSVRIETVYVPELIFSDFAFPMYPRKRKYRTIGHISGIIVRKMPLDVRPKFEPLQKICKLCAYIKRELQLSQTYYIFKLILLHYGYEKALPFFRDIKQPQRKAHYDKVVTEMLNVQKNFNLYKYRE